MPSAFLTIRSCLLVLSLLLGGCLCALIALFGPTMALQATVNGLVAGSYFGIGAIGLTLVLGVLKIVNLAHGDFLVAGAYLVVLFLWLGAPMPVAVVCSLIGTAILALATEKLVWRPLRSAGAGTLQLLLSAIGLSLIIRFSIQFFSGSQVRTLGTDVVTAISLGSLRIGVNQLIALVVGLGTAAIVALYLRFTDVGKDMRAFASNSVLAEVSGINARRIIARTWILSGALAAVAGIVYATTIGSFNPNFGLAMLLSLFAAALLGGPGNIYGALFGGLVIGLCQEWSTLFFSSRWKPMIGFLLLMPLLLFMPKGIFGRKERQT